MIQKSNPSQIQIQTKYGLLRYETPEHLTPEQQSVLAAYMAPKIATIPDVELEAFILRQINQALLLLGHSRQLQTPEEQSVMSDAISELIRKKYSFLTLPEIGLIFKKGVQGDYKHSPEDVVMVNLEKVHSWIKAYHSRTRAEVVASLKPVVPEKQKPEDYNPETDFSQFLQKVKTGVEITEAEWVCQTAQHYDRLNSSNAFNISTQHRKSIYQEEREKHKEAGKNRMLHINTETRFLFRAFVEGQTGENQYEKEVKTNCKIRVFREYVQELAKQQKAA